MPLILYRIVKTPEPRVEEFQSDMERAEPEPVRGTEAHRLWGGISMFATETQARRKAEAYPRLGRHIAIVRIPDGEDVRVERTLPRSRGHHTVWGDSGLLLSYVITTVPVRE